ESVTLAPIDGTYDQLLRPLTPSAWAVLLHRGAESQLDRIWVGPANAPENLKAWKPAGSFTRAPDDKVIEAYAVSPNGDLLAYVSSFPIYSVVVKSYKQRRIVQTLKLQDPGTEADVLGFATDDRLLVHRVNAKDGKDSL